METFIKLFERVLGDVTLPLYSSAIEEAFDGRDFGEMASPLEVSIIALQKTLRDELQGWHRARISYLVNLEEETSWTLDNGDLLKFLLRADELYAILLDPNDVGYKSLNADVPFVRRALTEKIHGILEHLRILSRNHIPAVAELAVETLRHENVHELHETRPKYRSLRKLADELWTTEPTAEAVRNFIRQGDLIASSEENTEGYSLHREALVAELEELEILELWRASTASGCEQSYESVK